MKVAIIGRSELMYETILLSKEAGHDIGIIITAREADEYTRTVKDFERISKELNAGFIVSPSLDRDEVYVALRNAQCDIAISVNYTGIISQKIIDLFRHGVLNAHGGDLPRYRGNACQAWAIINGEDRIALCVYKMVGNYLDGGKIIAREYFELGTKTRVTDCWNWICQRTPVLFVAAMEILERDSGFYIEDTLQSEIKPLRCYPRVPEDGRIDWQDTNLEIDRLVRASCEPYGGAFCFISGIKLTIWRAELFEDQEAYLAIPGQVASIASDHIIVICGRGKLKITEVEYEGKRGSPSVFIRSIRTRLH